jgi:hypothetical protein
VDLSSGVCQLNRISKLWHLTSFEVPLEIPMPSLQREIEDYSENKSGYPESNELLILNILASQCCSNYQAEKSGEEAEDSLIDPFDILVAKSGEISDCRREHEDDKDYRKVGSYCRRGGRADLEVAYRDNYTKEPSQAGEESQKLELIVSVEHGR